MKIFALFIIFLFSTANSQFLKDISPIVYDNKENSINISMSSLLITHMLLQISDIYLTHQILKNGGYEQNPIGEFLIRNNLEIPVKLIIIGFINYEIKKIYDKNPILGYVLIGIINSGMIYVDYHNYREWRLQIRL